MRRTVIAVAMVCTLGTGVSAAEAQEPSPAVAEETRVELPEHGFAVTLPDGWLVLCPRSEETLEALGGSGGTGRALDEQQRVALDTMAAMFSECQLIAVTLADEGAEVTDLCKADSGPLVPGTFDLNVDVTTEMLGTSEDVVSITTADVDLPAGRAAVIDVEYETRSPRHWANYLVERDEAILVITCTGRDRPADDWLSFAEAFEFLPADQ